MDDKIVFVSVGGTATDQQEDFVRAVEDRLRSEGLVPHTVGRNTFSAKAPLKAIEELLQKSAGMVVVALERSYFPGGLDRRGGPRQVALADVRLATPWNQIEAAMAYSRGLPLMVIMEQGLKPEGLLERGYDWYVQTVPIDRAALATTEFNGVLASWKQDLRKPKALAPAAATNPAELTVGQLVGGLKPTQLWGLLGALAVLVGGAFAVGGKLFG